MTEFMKGLLFGASLIFLIGAVSQISTNYKSEQDISNEFQNVYLNMQPKYWRVETSTPAPRDLKNAEVILYQSTNSAIVPRVYTELNGKLWSVNLSSQ